jgi:cardiolipin synthase
MNLPNFLSLLRLLMVPFFPIVYTSDVLYANWFAAGIYLAAACTDVIDGWLARRSNQITKLGRILDPLADKAMAFVVLLTITVAGVVHWWAVAVLFLKELTMGIGAITLFRKKNDVYAAVIIGKSATFIFFVTCMILTLFPESLELLWKNMLLAVAVGSNTMALGYYLFKYIKQARKQHRSTTAFDAHDGQGEKQ